MRRSREIDMRVSEIAAKSQVSPHTVRYYHKLGLLSSSRDPANRYRRFDVSAVERLRFVRHAKELGVSLAEIREILELSRAGESPCPRVRDIVRARISETVARIAELQRLQKRLELALQSWTHQPDRVPDGREVCHLIETFAAADD